MVDPKFYLGGTSIHYLEHRLEEQAASRNEK
jgi:acetyl-CoA carboxylase biotin carboxylase subunit